MKFIFILVFLFISDLFGVLYAYEFERFAEYVFRRARERYAKGFFVGVFAGGYGTGLIEAVERSAKVENLSCYRARLHRVYRFRDFFGEE